MWKTDKMASNTSSTTPSTSNTGNNSIVSTSVSQNTSATSLSLPETPSAQPTHKTKDGLIRMLLQTAAPSTPQQPKQIVNHSKPPIDTTHSNNELKIQGGLIGHYNNGHVTQPHPSAIHPLPKQPAQISSGTDARYPLGQMATKHFTINQSGAGTLISNLPTNATSHINTPTSATHNLKIDMPSSATQNPGSNVIASIIRDKILPSNSPVVGDKIESMAERIPLPDEPQFKFVHQISEQVNSANTLCTGCIFGGISLPILGFFPYPLYM